jgi:hypothetical protein
MRSTTAGLMALSSAVSGIGVYIAKDYFDFRTEQRAQERADSARLRDAQLALIGALQGYADVATGRKKEGPSFEALRKQVMDVYMLGDTIVGRVPEAKPSFANYADALVRVQSAAEQLSGPLDGKPFVEALSAALQAGTEFWAAVEASRSSFI